MNDFATETQQYATFQEIGIEPTLIAALERLNMAAPTEVQLRMIPEVMHGRDCLACVTTGAGKTNAYLLPIFQTLGSGAGLGAIIIQPTRALALQLRRNIQRFAPDRVLKVAVAAGDRGPRGRRHPADDNPDVLVGTPRGIADAIGEQKFDCSHVRMLVLDEADSMVEDGHADRLREIRQALPEKVQTVILAGTLSDDVRALAGDLLHDPARIEIDPGLPRAAAVPHRWVAVRPSDKPEAVLEYFRRNHPKLLVVITGTAQHADTLLRYLEDERIDCRVIGGSRGRQRRPARGRRSGEGADGGVVIAHDPAPRRLSTVPATHLLHYDLPHDVDTYLLRLEQVARLRRRGEVVLLVQPDQHELRDAIAARLDITIERLNLPLHGRRREGQRDGRRGRRERRGRDHGSAEAGGRPPRDRSRDTARRESAATGPQPSSTPTATTPPSAPLPVGRLNQLLYRDEELEARGVKPPRRTLGARFRTTRRPRPLRRP